MSNCDKDAIVNYADKWQLLNVFASAVVMKSSVLVRIKCVILRFYFYLKISISSTLLLAIFELSNLNSCVVLI